MVKYRHNLQQKGVAMKKEVELTEGKKERDFPDEIRFEISKLRFIIDYLNEYAEKGGDECGTIEVWGMKRSLESINERLSEIGESIEKA
jgi:hypothetical protein